MSKTRSAAGSLTGFAPWGGEEGVCAYLRPVGLLPVDVWAKGAAVPLAGGRFSFSMAELIVRKENRIERAYAPLAEIMAWGWERGREIASVLDQRLAALTRPRAPFGGLTLERPRIMGIVNVTPDSFSDGGDFYDPTSAIAHADSLLSAGAEILDVGGESTRPGAAPVAPEEEEGRVLPVIRHGAVQGMCVSVDTRHAPVMRAALAGGARIVNDISGLTGDSDSLALVASSPASVVLMHMQGQPGSMQQNPRYEDVALDVFDWLEKRVGACAAAGVPLERIAVDPGIGFGKTVEHNLQILRHLALYHGLGCALVVGVSRKSFIGHLSQGEAPKHRLPGSLAAGLDSLNQGVQILRVHDVAETFQARAVWEGLHPA